MGQSVIVIGAGITGVSTAEWLRRSGVEVTLVDRIKPGAPEQASYGNAGLLARCAVVPASEPGLLGKVPKMLLSNDAPLFLRWRYLPRLLPWLMPFLKNAQPRRMASISATLAVLTGDSVDQHIALAAGTPAESYIKTGDYMFYYRDKSAFEHDSQGNQTRRKLGFEFEELDRAALIKLDPKLSERYQYASRFSEHGWLSSPADYVAALADFFVKSGGKFVSGEVTAIEGNSVKLRDGRALCADKIVLAAGAWSASLARKLGQRPLLESERGYHLFLKNPSYMPSCPFMVTDAKFVVTPMRDGLRCAGIVEFAGLNAPPSDAPIKLLKKRIREVYPDLTWQSEETWMGHRPSTPDSLPHLGAIKTAPNVICAYGSQHLGITIGPRLGRMAADIVLGKRINMDISALDPDRFA